MARHQDRRVPVPAVPEVPDRLAVDLLRPGGDLARLARPVVVARDLAAVAAGVDHVGIARIGRHPAALASSHRVPVPLSDPRAGDGAGDGDRGLVLLRAVDPVGDALVHRHAVDLGRRLVVLARPGAAAVQADPGAAVVAQDHALGLVGVDPQVVVVAEARADDGEGAAAVDRLVQLDVREVDGVGLPRIGVDPAVVPGALAQRVRRAHPQPLLAAVVAAEETAVRGLHDRPHPVSPRRGHRHPDAADDPLGQPAGELPPAVAAVGRFVEPARRAAALDAPRCAIGLPERREQHARVVRVHGQVGGAGLVVEEQHPPPAPAAVARAIDAALGVRSPGVPQCGDVDGVGVPGIHHHARDVLRLAQADVQPALAGVGRPVDAVARRHVAAHLRLPGPDIDHVGVRRRHGDGADRAGREVAVRERFPAGAGVVRLPHAAAGAAEIERRRPAPHAGDRAHPPAAVGTDVAEAHAAEAASVEAGRVGGGRAKSGRAKRGEAQGEHRCSTSPGLARGTAPGLETGHCGLPEKGLTGSYMMAADLPWPPARR